MPAPAFKGARAICFSATASFTASAVLAVVGTVSLRQAHRFGLADGQGNGVGNGPGNGLGARNYPYAAIPLLFAAQQFIEGWLWLGLAGTGPEYMPSVPALTVLYLMFANILWPVYVPVAVLALETSAAHRRRLIVPLLAGIAVSLFFLNALITQQVWAEIAGHHIDYHLPHKYDVVAVLVYAGAACLAPLMSSHPMVRLFGGLLVASMIAAAAIYLTWFASVWCFFAALLSVAVLLQFRRRNT
ncbi:hypothetical protein GCM10009127_04280 [Alteraurantiacibacter aestuarii]